MFSDEENHYMPLIQKNSGLVSTGINAGINTVGQRDSR